MPYCNIDKKYLIDHDLTAIKCKNKKIDKTITCNRCSEFREDGSEYFTVLRLHADDIRSILENIGKSEKEIERFFEYVDVGNIAECLGEGLMNYYWDVLQVCVENEIDDIVDDECE